MRTRTTGPRVADAEGARPEFNLALSPPHLDHSLVQHHKADTAMLKKQVAVHLIYKMARSPALCRFPLYCKGLRLIFAVWLT